MYLLTNRLYFVVAQRLNHKDLINPFSESPQPSFHHSATPQKYLKTLSCNLVSAKIVSCFGKNRRLQLRGHLCSTARFQDANEELHLTAVCFALHSARKCVTTASVQFIACMCLNQGFPTFL